jgi:hypothetical protein
MLGFNSLSAQPLSSLSVASAPPSGNYTLTCNSGSYSVSGQSALLTKSKLITAIAGSYALNGVSANVLRSKRITAVTGSYSLTGQASNLLRSKLVTANTGSYSLVGQSAIVTWTGGAVNYTLTCNAGVYALSGQSSNVLKSKLLLANAGAYTYTGVIANLTRSKLITASAGAYALTGNNATLTKSASGAYTLTCSAGNYGLTGNSATLSYVSLNTVIQGGGNRPKAQFRRSETEEQKRLRREAQGIIERIKVAEPQQVEQLEVEAKSIGKELVQAIQALNSLAEQYQTKLQIQQANHQVRELQRLMIDAQLQSELMQQQQEELDVVYILFMLAAHI